MKNTDDLSTKCVHQIAVLAPDIPGHSSTFVYEELNALENTGLDVIPFSVHRPLHLAVGQACLAERVICLYESSNLRMALSGLLQLLLLGNKRRAFGWLIRDMQECGFASLAAWKLVFQFLTSARLAKHLVRRECTHLHIHFAHVPTQIGMYAAAMAGIPFTIMAHANDIFERGLLLARKAERARKFLTISEYNRAHLEAVGVAPEHMAVVRCGVSLPIREDLPPKVSHAVYRLGSLGRLIEKKGFDVLLQAVAHLRSRGYVVELSLAGDGPLQPELKALAHRLGLADCVQFEGNLSHDRVGAWMLTLDAFVLACKPDANGDMDGIPVVLMEAMSQLVPVVSTRLSGIPELVMDGQTGLLAEPGDAAGLAHCISRLIDSPDLGQSLARRGAAHVRTEFGQAVNIQRLLHHMGIIE